MAQQQIVRTEEGDTIKASDHRIKMSGSFSVDAEDLPAPGAEVTITVIGKVEGYSVDRTGPARQKGWTESVVVTSERMTVIETRIPEKDPELPLNGDPDEPTSLDEKRAAKE